MYPLTSDEAGGRDQRTRSQCRHWCFNINESRTITRFNDEMVITLIIPIQTKS